MRQLIDYDRKISYLENDTHLSAWVKQAGKVRAESDTIAVHNASHMKHGHWVVDAGAALGDHTLMYQDKVGAAGRVLAFEPNPDYFDCLKYNCPESSCFNLALWDQAGVQRLAMQRGGNAGAFYIGREDDGLMIKTIALDDLKLPRLDFFKLDIEGAELMAIKGATDTIKRCRPLIQCEVFSSALERCSGTSGTAEGLYAMIESLGYRVAFIESANDTGHHKELLATPQ